MSRKVTYITLLCAVIITGSIFAQAKPKKKKKPVKKQKYTPSAISKPTKNSVAKYEINESIEKAGVKLDKEILRLHERLEEYASMVKTKPKFLPIKIKVFVNNKKGKVHITMEMRDFLYKHQIADTRFIIGNKTFTYDAVLVNGKLQQVWLREDRVLVLDDQRTTMSLTNPKPLSKTTQHVDTRYFTGFQTIEKKIGQMENVVTNPQQNKFRQSFYIPRLRHFVDTLDRIIIMNDLLIRQSDDNIYEKFMGEQ